VSALASYLPLLPLLREQHAAAGTRARVRVVHGPSCMGGSSQRGLLCGWCGRVRSQLKRLARPMYSNPPSTGRALWPAWWGPRAVRRVEGRDADDGRAHRDGAPEALRLHFGQGEPRARTGASSSSRLACSPSRASNQGTGEASPPPRRCASGRQAVCLDRAGTRASCIIGSPLKPSNNHQHAFLVQWLPMVAV